MGAWCPIMIFKINYRMKTLRINIIGLHLASRLISRLEKAGLTVKSAQEICAVSDNRLAVKMMSAISTQLTLSEAREVEEDLARIKLNKQFKKLAEFKIKILTRPSVDDFRERRGEEFSFFHEKLNDKNFVSSSRFEIGAEKTAVVYQLIYNPSIRDCYAFIKAHQGQFLNAQGLILAYEQWQGESPNNLYFLGLDEKENLWLDSFGHYTIPILGIDGLGVKRFGLTNFKSGPGKRDLLIFFLP